MATLTVTTELLDNTIKKLKDAVKELETARAEMETYRLESVTMRKAPGVGDSMRAAEEFVGRLRSEIKAMHWEQLYGESQKEKRRGKTVEGGARSNEGRKGTHD